VADSKECFLPKTAFKKERGFFLEPQSLLRFNPEKQFFFGYQGFSLIAILKIALRGFK